MKSTLKISTDNTEALETAISAVAGRKKAFIHTVSDLLAAAAKAEAKLEALGLAKAHRAGASLLCTLEGPARSYRYSAEGTQVDMVRKASGWVVSAIVPTHIYPGAAARHCLTISKAQRDLATASLLRSHSVSVAYKAAA